MNAVSGKKCVIVLGVKSEGERREIAAMGDRNTAMTAGNEGGPDGPGSYE